MKIHPIAKAQFLVAALMLLCGIAILKTTGTLYNFLAFSLCFLAILLGVATYILGRIGLAQKVFIFTPMHKISLTIAKFISKQKLEDLENQYQTERAIRSAGLSNQISGIIVILAGFVFLFAYLKGNL